MSGLNPLAMLLTSSYLRNRKLPPEISSSPLIDSALSSIRARWPDVGARTDDSEAPIFVLSAGWGSGSTLLQRLVVSTGNCLVWGEPIDHAAPIQRLTQMIMPISETWPRPQSFEFPASNEKLSDNWIANLTPGIEYLRQGQRALIREWLKVPAIDRGHGHWGMKEVRLTISHARYLRWLFPKAKFLFIYRDVKDSYRSCKKVNWYSIWPGYRVADPVYFVHHWKFLLEGFLSEHSSVGGQLIQYEKLVNNEIDLGALSDYLGIGQLDGTILGSTVGARATKRPALTRTEHFIIDAIGGDLRARASYVT